MPHGSIAHGISGTKAKSRDPGPVRRRAQVATSSHGALRCAHRDLVPVASTGGARVLLAGEQTRREPVLSSERVTEARWTTG